MYDNEDNLTISLFYRLLVCAGDAGTGGFWLTLNTYTDYRILCYYIGLQQCPYWSRYGKPRLVIYTVINSKYFDLAIAGVIGLNVITMATESYMMPSVSRFIYIFFLNGLHIYITSIFS